MLVANGEDKCQTVVDTTEQKVLAYPTAYTFECVRPPSLLPILGIDTFTHPPARRHGCDAVPALDGMLGLLCVVGGGGAWLVWYTYEHNHKYNILVLWRHGFVATDGDVMKNLTF